MNPFNQHLVANEYTDIIVVGGKQFRCLEGPGLDAGAPGTSIEGVWVATGERGSCDTSQLSPQDISATRALWATRQADRQPPTELKPQVEVRGMSPSDAAAEFNRHAHAQDKARSLTGQEALQEFQRLRAEHVERKANLRRR